MPGTSDSDSILAFSPQGVLLSNGPGNPAEYKEAILTIQALLARSIPLFGICLGHQLLGLASGAKTIRLKQGHHGSNHPIGEIATGKSFVSSQNHDYVIDVETLPPHLRVTHRFLIDGSIAGMRRTDKPAFGFQGHPEASPGPRDLRHLFDHFFSLMDCRA